MPSSPSPVQGKHRPAQFILLQHPSCKITSEYIATNYRPPCMQIITLSIIHRELWVYTTLYRTSNAEDKGSEWGNLISRDFSWNDMIGWRGKKKCVKEGKGWGAYELCCSEKQVKMSPEQGWAPYKLGPYIANVFIFLASVPAIPSVLLYH